MFTARPRPDIELRLLEERHVDVVFALVDKDRDYLRQWLPWVDATVKPDDTLQFIRGALERFSSKGEIAAGIWHQGRFAGVIGTHKLDRLNHHVEIGYWLGREFQGHGIMTDCCRLLVNHLLVEMQMNRVEILCAAGNARSCAIPPRLGFTLDGTLRKAQHLYGCYHDLLVWSMLRSEARPTES